MAADGDERDMEAFRGYIEEFRETGAALLLTGKTPASVRARASQRLFGATSEPHCRILLSLTGGHRPAEYLPPQVTATDERVTVIATPTETRGAEHPQLVGGASTTEAAAVTGDDARAAPPEGRLREAEPLATLERAFLRTVAANVPASGAFEPNRLRVGVTSTLPLFSRATTDAVRTFCTSVIDTVRAHDGVVHLHLPVPDSAARHRALAQYVDGRVELRAADTVEWRWHVPSATPMSPTGWFEV